jgi:hypothetical protein
MQNKPKKRWLDTQIIITSLAISISLGLWNIFARASAASTQSGNTPPPTPDPGFTYTLTPAEPAATTGASPLSAIHLPPVHILLGGKQPVARTVILGSSSGAPIVNGSTGSSSSQASAGNSAGTSSSTGSTAISNPAPAPAPVTVTSSSKP